MHWFTSLQYIIHIYVFLVLHSVTANNTDPNVHNNALTAIICSSLIHSHIFPASSIMHPQGHIVTNYHVIASALKSNSPSIKVKLQVCRLNPLKSWDTNPKRIWQYSKSLLVTYPLLSSWGAVTIYKWVKMFLRLDLHLDWITP